MKAVGKQAIGSALRLAAVLLVACTPAAAPTAPATVGLSNPRSLATVFISPTAEVAQEQASPVALQPSPAPAGALPTPSATPYVGIFLGASTIEPEGPIAPPPAPTPRGVCITLPAPPFNSTWTANPLLQERLRCPVNSGFGLRLVYQPFERGHMYWRDTGDIYALSEQSIRQGSATDAFWRVSDTWQEGQPESDPALQPPEGLLQPVRGFGNVWRNNPTIRDALGWATAAEQWFDSFWQDFEGGWMMVGPGGQAFALVPADANTGFHFGALPGG